jgi:hypothetical protein
MTAPAAPARRPDFALWRQRWQRFSAAFLRAFHAYATWLVSISWRRFILLAVLALIVMGILHDMPPFTWTVTEQVEERVPRASAPRPPKPPAPPQPAEPRRAPQGATSPGVDAPIRIETPKKGDGSEGLDISIGKDGIRITPCPRSPGR